MFWEEGGCIEVVKTVGDRSLLAGLIGGCIRFGEVDWSDPARTAATITTADQLKAWR
jgi:hypothetical protein